MRLFEGGVVNRMITVYHTYHTPCHADDNSLNLYTLPDTHHHISIVNHILTFKSVLSNHMNSVLLGSLGISRKIHPPGPFVPLRMKIICLRSHRNLCSYSQEFMKRNGRYEKDTMLLFN